MNKKIIKLVVLSTMVITASELFGGFGSSFGGGLVGGMVGGSIASSTSRPREVYVNTNNDDGYYQSKAADLQQKVKLLKNHLNKKSITLEKYKKIIKKYMKMLADKGVKVKNEIKNDKIDVDDFDDDDSNDSDDDSGIEDTK